MKKMMRKKWIAAAIACVGLCAAAALMGLCLRVTPVARDRDTSVSLARLPFRIGLHTIDVATGIDALRTPLGEGDVSGQTDSSNVYWETAYRKIADAYPSEKVFLLDVNWDDVPEMLTSQTQSDAKAVLTQYRAGQTGATLSGKATVNAAASYDRIDLYRKGKTGAYLWLGKASSATVRQLVDQIGMQSGNLKVTRLFEERVNEKGGVQYFYRGKKTNKKSYTKQYNKFFKTYIDQQIDAPSGNSASLEQVVLAYKQLRIAPIHVSKIKLNKGSVSFGYGASYTLKATVTPAYATARAITWLSSDSDLVRVDAGKITAVGFEGKATITALAPSGAKKTMVVTVKRPAAKSVSISGDTTVDVGETIALSAEVAPFAANQAVKWSSAKKSVAVVDADGVVTGVRAGTAKITATAGNRKKATVSVTVAAKPVEAGDVTRRAVLLAAGQGDVGSYNENLVFASDVDKMRRAISRSTFGDAPIAVTRLDNAFSTGSAALSGIVAALAGADENDVSYVYLMCHGARPSSSRYYIRLGTGGSGALATSAQLRAALDRVPGKIVLMMSCCFSGDVIGKRANDSQMADFVDDFMRRGIAAKSGEFKTDKYYVLCGSSRTQVGWYSYRPGSNTGCSFLCNGVNAALGVYNAWTGDATEDWPADTDGDGAVTMRELYAYVGGHVKQLCLVSGIDDYSRVQVWPENSDFVVFQK